MRSAAYLMAAAARTAPKTRGEDSVQTMIVDGEDLEVLAAASDVVLSMAPDASGDFDRAGWASSPCLMRHP